MTESLTPLERWKELAHRESRMKRRLIGRDDMHAYAWPLEAAQGDQALEICDHPADGRTFALIAGQALEAKDRRPLFTGYVKKGMATQLRKLAHRCR